MRLPVLCPQEYEGVSRMRVVPCTRCSAGWSQAERRCTVYVGCEHLPLVAADAVPACPIADRCQHDRQQPGPCVVHLRGLVCESALVFAGESNAAENPLAFNASMM